VANGGARSDERRVTGGIRRAEARGEVVAFFLRAGSGESMQVCVVDGQGGGIGSIVVRKLRDAFGDRLDIVALGTNAIATAAMLKAGANRGASGENAVVRNAGKAHVIVGSIGVLMAHAMMGELTPAMAEAIAGSSALKILIPVTQERVAVVGVTTQPLPHMIDELIGILQKEANKSHV
jgi:hypothetical protein